MLSIYEFSVGSLDDAQPLALMLPRKNGEEKMLVGPSGANRLAVFLDGQYKFHSFEYNSNSAWAGLIVKNIHIELDETSLFDPDRGNLTTGTLIRRDRRLCIWAYSDRPFKEPYAATLIDGLEPTAERERAAFARWQIVVGSGTGKRVLLAIDASP